MGKYPMIKNPDPEARGFYVDVDIEPCGDQPEFRNNGLATGDWKNQPMVQINLNCQAYCWLSEGTNSIYWTSATTFRVYIKNEYAWKNEAMLKNFKWHLMWTITSRHYEDLHE